MESVTTIINLHRILLIEDDPIIQKIHKSFLIKMGYEVDVTASGEHAITIYNDEYDAVVLDANLPDLDGFAVAKYIRQQESINQQPAKPIILLSAYSKEYLAQECLQTKINAFATKPISYDALQAIISEHVQKKFSVEVDVEHKKQQNERSYQR